MKENDIKKALYRQKPIAKRILNTGEDEDHYLYNSQIEGEDLWFRVPIKEMGENKFEEEVPAQLLIRWLQN